MNEAFDYIKLIKSGKLNLQMNIYGQPTDRYYYKSRQDKYRGHKQKLGRDAMLN
jgi:hypothetical protein